MGREGRPVGPAMTGGAGGDASHVGWGPHGLGQFRA